MPTSLPRIKHKHHMSIQISKSIRGLRSVIESSGAPEAKVASKPLLNRNAVRTITLVTVLGLGLALSISCNFLFFKELLISGAIFGMAMFLKAAQRPLNLNSKETRD